ncbi:unnamed protein product [Hapterophycus canaliculatus]
MSNSNVTVDGTAYLKLMLHAAKYPWATVNGFLLGEAGSGGQARTSDCRPTFAQVSVKDAVPLFHTSTLAPLLETSAAMVDAHASSNGLSIVGFYQANQCLDDNSPGALASKIMDKIDSSQTGSAVLLLISNKRLEVAGDSALSAFGRDANNSFRKHIEVAVAAEVVETFEAALLQRTEAKLVDMDEHLDDVSKDWRNPGIVSA